jgi:hypothetical protein
LKNEFARMFHVLMAFLNECVPFPTTSIVVSSASCPHTSLTCCRCSIQLKWWSSII